MFSGRSAIAVAELAQQARLADAGLADDRDQVRAALADDAVEQRLQHLRLVVAADQRRLRAGRAGGAGDGDADRLPGGHRLRLALQLERLELLVLDRVAGEPVGDLADGDAARARRGLEPGGDVDRVAHDRVVAVADLAGEHLARVDADPQLEVDVVVGDLVVDLVHRRLHRDRRPAPPARGRPRARPGRRRRPSRCRRCTCRPGRRSGRPPRRGAAAPGRRATSPSPGRAARRPPCSRRGRRR